MIVKLLQYQKAKGWSTAEFPQLDSEGTLILVFSSPSFSEDPSPINTLASYYPNSLIVGCSTAGEIFGTAIYDDSLSVAIVKFEKTGIRLASESLNNAESFLTGEAISAALSQSPDLAGVFVLSEGLNVNGSELVKGLNSALEKQVVITGGLAGDGSRFAQTWLIENGKIVKNKVIGIGFYGKQIHIGHGSKGGWDIFGMERRITKSKNNVLYELDGKPALSLYKQYLGEKAGELPASGLLYPLAIRKNINDTKQLVRTILSVNEAEGSLTFAGDVPTGYLAQLMRANFDRLVSGAREAGEYALAIHSANQTEKPILLVAVSCVGRRLLLGERTEEEINSILELFPSKTPMVGFYSYGELSPYATGDCDLHNQTMTLTSFSED